MESLYDASGSIELDRVILKLVDGPSCPAEVVLRLSPDPTIYFDLLDSSSEFQTALLDAIIEDAPIVIELPSAANVQVVERNQSLTPRSGSVTALDTGKLLHAARFGVINFPDFIQPQTCENRTADSGQRSLEKLHTIHLKGGPWLVEVRPVDDHKQVHESLRQQRGFAVTHWGEVTRLDGKPFPKESVQPFMATLNQFLSFARGVSCGMTLVRGLDEAGKTVWEEWGVTKVQPWKGHRSCLDRQHGATLGELFEGFWDYSRARLRDSQTHPALEWYLESNAQEASHTSIVLNQAALERLTVEVVGTKKREEKDGDWIARALCKVQADVTIPVSFKKALGTKSFKHGPHALVDLRNDLIHPEMKNGIRSSEVYRQARELGLWYVELLLLAVFGYRGLYSNRLTMKWTDEVGTVPWASPI